MTSGQYGGPSSLRDIPDLAAFHRCPQLSKWQQWFG